MNDTNTPAGKPKRTYAPRRRRADRQLEFTDEAMATLPVSKNHMDFWHDTKMPALAARRMDKDTLPEFIFRYTPVMRASYQSLLGTKLPTYHKIGHVSVENARKAAEEILMEARAVEGRWRRTQSDIPAGRQLLRDPLDLNKPPVENPDYEKLMNTLMEAYQQATEGKGKERHGRGISLEDQDMLQLLRRAGIGFGIGQACKKALEAQHRKMGEARTELLGAIVYLAGTVIYLDEVISKVGPDK